VKRIVLILVIVAGMAAVGYWSSRVFGGVQQPVAFPHKTHIALGLPCTTCHQRAEKDAVAGRPPTALCLGCHAGGDTKSAEIKKIRAYAEKGQEIPWRRIWRLPPHVFFPHQVHVKAAKIKCQTCHGPMETLVRPAPRPLKTLAMQDCINCHAERMWTRTVAGKTVEPTKLAAHRMSANCIMCHR
jgi:Cytochrome c7 and related cytochrome c/Class III cytochrome C family